MANSLLPTQILFTLAYTDQFDFPLTESEISSRLIALDGKSSSLIDVSKTLSQLVSQKKVGKNGQYYFLPGRDQIVALRESRQKVAEEKWQEIQVLKTFAHLLPDVLVVFVTGSLAMNNTDLDDDIDLLVVTKRHRLWLTRFQLILLSFLLGKKKRRFDEGKHGWCFNLWLDEDHLAVPELKRDLYQAYEVVQARPLFVRDQTVVSFYKKNEWLKEYLPLVKLLSSRKLLFADRKPAFWSALVDVLDEMAYWLQKQYMKSHQTTERVSGGFAFFHPRPTTRLVKEGWLTSIQRLKNHQELGTIAKHYAGTLFTSPTPTVP